MHIRKTALLITWFPHSKIFLFIDFLLLCLPILLCCICVSINFIATFCLHSLSLSSIISFLCHKVHWVLYGIMFPGIYVALNHRPIWIVPEIAGWKWHYWFNSSFLMQSMTFLLSPTQGVNAHIWDSTHPEGKWTFKNTF